MSGALVCGHVADGEAPILLAIRDEPDDVVTSGWQLLCMGGEAGEQEDPRAARVWPLEKVIEVEPSLEPHLDAPPGTVLTRESVDESWQVVEEGG